jgi:hypothetical protein
MRLEMDRDHLPVLGQLGQIAPEAVWVDAPVKKNERLAGAMHAEREGSQSALRSLWQSSGNRV